MVAVSSPESIITANLIVHGPGTLALVDAVGAQLHCTCVESHWRQYAAHCVSVCIL